MAVNLRDVARAAGVSHGTVSNVINGLASVQPHVRSRVLSAIEATGYVRNETARQLRAGHSRMLGVILLDTANPFFNDLAQGIQSEPIAENVALMLCSSNNDPATEQEYVALFEEHRALGIILAAGQVSAELLGKLIPISERGTPLVLISGSEDSHDDLCTVCGDDDFGAGLVARHLIGMGHRRVAMVNGPSSLNVCRVRQEGFERVLHASAPDAEVRFIERPELRIPEGYAAAQLLLADPADRPTAVFCANDLLALGVLQYAVEAGISVPDELAIVGYDDIAFAAGAAIPLTSVHQSGRDIGAAAADLLKKETAEGTQHRHRHLVFRPTLMARTSTTGRRESAR